MSVTRVLVVGNCSADHAMIRNMIEDGFDAEVEGVMLIGDALKALKSSSFQLVLVNRLIFDDQSEGIGLVESMRRDAELADVPVMLVSNFESAQRQAMALGAEPGFGKSAIAKSETLEKLARFLPRRAARIA